MGKMRAMMELSRLTTEYIDYEDRLRLAGSDAQEGGCALWLTRRLLDRLLPHVFAWLEGYHGKLPRADLLTEFAQQRAVGALTETAPVSIEEAPQLVYGVDVTTTNEQLHLVFKSAQGPLASMGFQPDQLHQWLSILNAAYERAGWSRAVWPQWLHAASMVPAPATRSLH